MPSRLASTLFLLLASGLIFAAGCSGEHAAPTKIYEGGGTMPEVVDQPEPPAKSVKGMPRK
jgi:hypothetical protein